MSPSADIQAKVGAGTGGASALLVLWLAADDKVGHVRLVLLLGFEKGVVLARDSGILAEIDILDACRLILAFGRLDLIEADQLNVLGRLGHRLSDWTRPGDGGGLLGLGGQKRLRDEGDAALRADDRVLVQV